MKMNLNKEFKEIIEDYRKKKLDPNIEKALTEMGNYIIPKLEAASPVGDTVPHYRDSWYMKTQYNKVRYIKNSKKDASGFPFSQFLEYGPYAKPHIGITFAANKNEMIQIFMKTMKQGGI
jgi:hypothetical protein